MQDLIVCRPLHDLRQHARRPGFCAVAQLIPQCILSDRIIENCVSTLRMIMSKLESRGVKSYFVTIETLAGIALVIHFTSLEGYNIESVLRDEPFLHILNSASLHKLLTFLKGDVMDLNYILISVRHNRLDSAQGIQRCNTLCSELARLIDSLQPAIRVLGVENPYYYQTKTKDKRIHHCTRCRIFTSHDLESVLYRTGHIDSLGHDETRSSAMSICLFDVLAKKLGTDAVSDIKIFSRAEEEAIQSKKA